MLAFFGLSSAALAQDATGKIYVIRRTGVNGSAVNFRLFVDGELICKLKNKSYSVHELKAGEHTISVVTGGIPNNKKTQPVRFTVSGGKINYFMINNGDELNCVEIMPYAAEPMIARSLEVKNCLEVK